MVENEVPNVIVNGSMPAPAPPLPPPALDAYPPTIATGLVGTHADPLINLQWDAAGDPNVSSIAGSMGSYEVSRDGAVIGTVSSPGIGLSPVLTLNQIPNTVVGTAVQDVSDWTLTSNGLNMSGAADNFSLLSTPLSGNFTLIMKVSSWNSTYNFSKIGVMVRQNTTVGGAYAQSLVFPITAGSPNGNGVNLEFRTAQDGPTSLFAPAIQGPIAPCWLKITRVGSTLTSYYSTDSNTWSLIGSANVIMTDPVLAGVAISAGSVSAGTVTCGIQQLNIQNQASPVLADSPDVTVAHNYSVVSIDASGNRAVAGAQVLVAGTVINPPPPPSGRTYPQFSSALIGGSPRSYDTDAFIQWAGKQRSVVMGVWDGWQSGRIRNMKQVCDALKAANPNIKIGLYIDSITVSNPQTSGNSGFKRWQVINAGNWWLRAPYPGGAIVDATYYQAGYSVVNQTPGGNAVSGRTQNQYEADWTLDIYVLGGALGLHEFTNVANPTLDGIFSDDLMPQAPVTGDWDRNGTSEGSNATTDAGIRTGMIATLNRIRAGMQGGAGLRFANLSRLGTAGVPTTEFNGQLDGGLLEGMIGYNWSTETWDTFPHSIALYNKIMGVLTTTNWAQFGHSNVATNGTDPYDAAPYQAQRFGLCFALLGDADYYTARSNAYDCNQLNFFDEWAINGSGVCQAYSSSVVVGGYLGTAIDPPQTAPRGGSWPANVYAREFQFGWAIVNPKGNGTVTLTPALVGGANACKVPLGTQDPAFNSGASISGNFTMLARTGRILLKRSRFG